MTLCGQCPDVIMPLGHEAYLGACELQSLEVAANQFSTQYLGTVDSLGYIFLLNGMIMHQMC